MYTPPLRPTYMFHATLFVPCEIHATPVINMHQNSDSDQAEGELLEALPAAASSSSSSSEETDTCQA